MSSPPRHQTRLARTLPAAVAVLAVLVLLVVLVVRHAPFYLPSVDPPPDLVLETEEHRVFGYATLTRPLVRLVVVGRIVPSEPALLEGYRRTGRNIVPEPEGAVPGDVFTVSGPELWRLDRYERRGTSYRRLELELSDGSSAWVYIETD